VAGVLAGFTIAVTADRRRDELATVLEAHGARIVLAPALRIVPPGDDVRLRAATVVPGHPADAEFTEPGADVIETPGYRFAPPIDPTPLQRLVDLITNRLVDAVTFTSAPAVAALLRTAESDLDAMLGALRTDVLAACVGPVTAEPLRRHEVFVLAPARAQLDALADALIDELPRRTRSLRVGGAELVLRGHAAVVDGLLKPLPPAQMAVLRSLAASPGRVLSRTELLAALPRGADEHAVEMAVARLRAALGRSSFIQTVVKRGYRLRVD
jgi:uroporphyrinogen-III synthase